MKYQVIYADPPWSYRSKGISGTGKHNGAETHYVTMTDKQLSELEVPCTPDSICFMWATYPKLDVAIRTMEAWGFSYKTVAFVWNKVTSRNKAEKLLKETLKDCGVGSGIINHVLGWLPEEALAPTLRFGQGHYTRGGSEIVLCGVRGKGVPIIDKGVRRDVFASVKGLRHSEKPLLFRELIDQMVGPELKKLEMFARCDGNPSWDIWGNEVDSTDGVVIGGLHEDQD